MLYQAYAFVLSEISDRVNIQMDLKLSTSAAQFNGLPHIGNEPCFKVSVTA